MRKIQNKALRKRKMHQPFLYNVAVDSVIVSVKVTVIQICNASFALSFLENNKVYKILYLSCFCSLIVSLEITKVKPWTWKKWTINTSSENFKDDFIIPLLCIHVSARFCLKI